MKETDCLQTYIQLCALKVKCGQTVFNTFHSPQHVAIGEDKSRIYQSNKKDVF